MVDPVRRWLVASLLAGSLATGAADDQPLGEGGLAPPGFGEVEPVSPEEETPTIETTDGPTFGFGYRRCRVTFYHTHDEGEPMNLLDATAPRAWMEWRWRGLKLLGALQAPASSRHSDTREVYGVQSVPIFGPPVLAPGRLETHSRLHAYEALFSWPLRLSTDLQLGQLRESLSSRIRLHVPGARNPVALRRVDIETQGFVGLHVRQVIDRGLMVDARLGLTHWREEIRGPGEITGLREGGGFARALRPKRHSTVAELMELGAGYEFPSLGGCVTTLEVTAGWRIGMMKSESHVLGMSCSFRF